LTDDRVAGMEDLGVRSAAIAAAGPAVALVARIPGGTTDQLATLAARLMANALPPMAAVLVTGRVDVALGVRARGVILRGQDIEIAAARMIARGTRGRTGHRGNAADLPIWILRSVHSEDEAARAIDEGADGVIAGPIWETATHPGHQPAGTAFLERIVSLGAPTYAIGGVTPERAAAVRAAGGWGIAAISAVWDAPRPYLAAIELLEPWTAT
jgi:thiamine-phosphate diphosphorylase